MGLSNRQSSELASAVISAVAYLDIEDVFDKDAILVYVAKNYAPEDVFLNEELDTWAEENGFVKA